MSSDPPQIRFHHEPQGTQIEMKMHGTTIYLTPSEVKLMRDRLTQAMASIRNKHQTPGPHGYRAPHDICTYCGRGVDHVSHKKKAPA